MVIAIVCVTLGLIVLIAGVMVREPENRIDRYIGKDRS